MTGVEDAVDAVYAEYDRAQKKFPRPFVNAHEGISIIREEFEELWDEVKADNREKQLKEAVQVAAMAIRFVVELSGPRRGPGGRTKMNLTRRMREWAKRYVNRHTYDIAIGKRRFMYRWYIIPRNPVMNIYLHEWWASDDDRALHDHPWWSWSWALGPHTMVEEYQTHHLKLRMSRAIKPGQKTWRRATFAHRIVVDKTPTYTLFVTGPRLRIWGFWCASGWRDFKKFDKHGCE